MPAFKLSAQSYCPCCDRIIEPGDAPCHPKTSLSPISKDTLSITGLVPGSDYTLHLQNASLSPSVERLGQTLASMLSVKRWGQEKAQRAFDTLVAVACLKSFRYRLETETKRRTKLKAGAKLTKSDTGITARIHDYCRMVKLGEENQ